MEAAMHRKVALSVLAACASCGCDDYQVVDKSQQIVISKQEYEQLKAAAAQAKQVGRYQLHREGTRTWRLDTATGRSCLLLASQSDWDSKEGKAQNSCTQEDYNEAQERHRLYPSVFDGDGNPIPPKNP
jgi:hypothetical protein